jgi:hypothetical protein
MEVSDQLHVPAALSSGERSPVIHWIGRWMGHRAGPKAVAKRKNPITVSCRESNPGRPAHRLVTILTELPLLLPIQFTVQLI